MRQLYIYLALEMERTLQDKYIFNLVYSAQEEGWRLDKAAIAIQTNPFSAQREYNNIISFNNKIIKTI